MTLIFLTALLQTFASLREIFCFFEDTKRSFNTHPPLTPPAGGRGIYRPRPKKTRDAFFLFALFLLAKKSHGPCAGGANPATRCAARAVTIPRSILPLFLPSSATFSANSAHSA